MHIHGGNIYKNKVVADFSANLNFLGMPESVKRAAKEGILCSQSYPDPDTTLLRDKLACYHGIQPEQIICGNGAAELIFALVAEYKPKKALLLAPSFYEYTQALVYHKCLIEEYLLKEETMFCLQEDFLDRMKPDVDIIFLCNPNNPTGQLIDQKILEAIMKKCAQLNILCVIDECFLSFIRQTEDASCISKLADYPICILKAFTKIYAMPGIRLGYLISANESLLSGMKQGMQPWNVSVIAQIAGAAALDEKEYLEKTKIELKKEKDFLLDQLQLLGYKVYGSAANFIFFRGEPSLYKEMLQEGMMIRDCSNFSGLESGFFRIAVRTKKENRMLIEALRRKKHG